MKTPKTYFYLLLLLSVFSCEKQEMVQEATVIEYKQHFDNLLKKSTELREAVLVDYVANGNSNVGGKSNVLQVKGCYYAYSSAEELALHINNTPKVDAILKEARGFMKPLVGDNLMLVKDKFELYELLRIELSSAEVVVIDFMQYVIKHPEDQIQCNEVLSQVNNDVARIITEIVTVTTKNQDE